MKKIFTTLLVAAALMIGITAKAQVKFGVKGGVNVTSMSFNNSVFDASNRTGFFIGPTVKIQLPLVGLGIDASALYDQREAKVKVADNYTTDKTLRCQAINVPINLRYGWGLSSLANVFLFAGPQFGFNVGKKNHLTWDEIRELKRRGHEIASHTVSHVSLTGLLKRGDTNEVHRQYCESRDAIRRELGEAPRFMCHPYVAFDETTDALCREDGMTPMSPRRHNFGHGTKAGTASGIGAAIVRWRAEGRRSQDVLMHGVCPGGGWHPFDSKEDFAAFLDEIREREKRGEVKVVPYSEFMSALAREPEFLVK